MLEFTISRRRRTSSTPTPSPSQASYRLSPAPEVRLSCLLEKRLPLRPGAALFALAFSCILTLGCTPSRDGSASDHGEHDLPSDSAERQAPGIHNAVGDGPSEEVHGEHGEDVVELTAAAAEIAGLRTTLPEQRHLDAQFATTGQVDFDQDRVAHVSPRISGRVHKVHAVLGQKVKADEILAEIDSIELGQAKAAFLQAKAKSELKSKSFERAESLLAEGIAAQQEVLETEAELREAVAELNTREEMLRLFGLGQHQIDALRYEDRQASIYPLRAPFSGTVTERHMTLGELATPESLLFTLADLDRVWIWIDVYQRDLGRVHLDDEARARVDSFPGESFNGKVSYLSPEVDTATRTVRARIDVRNLRGRLRPGMFVEVELLDPHARDDGPMSLVIPEGAVVREGDGSAVFVALGGGQFRRQPVVIGRRTGGFIEVVEGLRDDETVVSDGAFLLKSASAKDSLGGGHSH